METKNKRIPFDWEKYQSGEYEAVCRDGRKPEQIVYYPTALSIVKITALVDGKIETFNDDGSYKFLRREESEFDLFLIPKRKKFQAWVNLYSNGECYSYYTEKIAKRMIEVYRTKNREIIETRLIEWEG
jgi:hypothetical protein